MDQGSVFSGAAFRSAILLLLTFLATIGVAGFVILGTTQSSLQDEIKAHVNEDLDMLRDALQTGDGNELAQFVDEATPARAPGHYLIGMFDKDGNRLAGDVAELPDFRGWGYLRPAAEQATSDSEYLAYVGPLGDSLVVVGRSTRLVTTASTALWRALLMAGAVMCVGAVVIGYVFSHRVSFKLARFATILDEVSRGNSNARLPIGRSNDQVDRIARQINAHLDRLSDLMATMRNTIVAIAHDLRTPLNRASILLQEAAENPEARTAPEILGEAQAELDKLSGVFDTVLRISRIETSDDQSAFTAFSASELVAEMAQTFEPVVEEAGQQLRCSGSAPATIFGDRRMVQQLLVNLIENASRYGAAGTIIDLQLQSDQGGCAITVADNGPGIPADKRREVLQPFRQLNVERDARGSGLGLALVNAIAVRNHASLELSDNAPGLKVTVRFPAVKLAA